MKIPLLLLDCFNGCGVLEFELVAQDDGLVDRIIEPGHEEMALPFLPGERQIPELFEVVQADE